MSGRLTQLKKFKEQIDDIVMYTEGLDSYIISSFVSSLNEFMKNSEDLTVTKNLDNEFSKMKDIVEQHKKKLV